MRVTFKDKDKDFLFGVATSGPQVNGRGPYRGQSIWDIFCKKVPQPSDNLLDGRTNHDVACDHYHRYREDFALMKRLGVRHHRTSIEWPRVLPMTDGSVSAEGLDFHERQVDELLLNGIEPWLTLSHFDLPEELQQKYGGWQGRETAERFRDYTDIVTRRLGDRVKKWWTINEPTISMFMGYITGNHAPGYQRRLLAGLRVIHNQLLAHGYGMQVIRDNVPDSQCGIVHFQSPIETLSKSPLASGAAGCLRLLGEDMVLTPLLMGRYPVSDMVFEKVLQVQSGDMDVISKRMDYLGLDYYFRLAINGWGQWMEHVPDFLDYTTMGWDVTPDRFEHLLLRLKQKYPNLPPIIITENGAAFEDVVVDGQVHDRRRVKYLRDHLYYLSRAITNGVDVRGYFVWSFLDNFEWGKGYDPRFGIVHVDYATLARTVKDSGLWYAQVIANKGFDLDETA